MSKALAWQVCRPVSEVLSVPDGGTCVGSASPARLQKQDLGGPPALLRGLTCPGRRNDRSRESARCSEMRLIPHSLSSGIHRRACRGSACAQTA